MTIDELKTKLNTLFTEEVNDSKKYLEMSDIPSHDDNHCEKQIFHDMAREEYIHAKHIKELIDIHGIEANKDTEKMYHELEYTF